MDEVCALCERPFGRLREKHHIVPKSKGGKVTIALHPICHSKIHSVFTRTELTNLGTIEALKTHPDMKKFIRWLSKKHPDFHAPTK